MNYIKENRNLIIIATVLIAFTLLFVFMLNSNRDYNDEYKLSDKEYLRNYQINEVIPITITEEQMAKKYLSEYVGLLINDPQKAYELLEPEYREIAYPTYTSFKEYVDKIKNDSFYKTTLLKYEIKIVKNYKIFNLYDMAENNFIFREHSIMNYTVLLDNYTL